MEYSLHNNFFNLQYDLQISYYIYIYPTLRNKDYKFIVSLLEDNGIYIFINNKVINRADNFKIKIMKNDKTAHINQSIKLEYDIALNDKIEENNLPSAIIILQNINESTIKIADISKLHYVNGISRNNAIINNDSIFDVYYYHANNPFLKNTYLNDVDFIKMHWNYTGQYNPQLYFKQSLYKYRDLILNLKYSKIIYDPQKNNTLLFIDDRYDPSFLYIATLFLYSVDESWNIRVYTTEDCRHGYEADFEKLGLSNGIISILDNKFSCIDDYSNLLKSSAFWSGFSEENCLLFQYDSFCGGKFKKEFFSHNYLGALWDHHACNACKINNVLIGNGGTSFRKRSVMQRICQKYEGVGGGIPEDVFFALFLNEESLLPENCDAVEFSFENIFSDKSIYGHQIYKSIAWRDLDAFIYNKLKSMTTN